VVRAHWGIESRVTSCSAPWFSVIRSQSLTGAAPVTHQAQGKGALRLPKYLCAPGHSVAPENRRCQAMSNSAAHSVGGSRSSPTPSWLMTWAVGVSPQSAGGLPWIGQRPIRSDGSQPTPFPARYPSHSQDQVFTQTPWSPLYGECRCGLRHGVRMTVTVALSSGPEFRRLGFACEAQQAVRAARRSFAPPTLPSTLLLSLLLWWQENSFKEGA